MALVVTVLEAAIGAALNKQSDSKVDPADARAEMAKDIAAAVDAYIKSGTVNVVVATTGTAAAQTGTGTGAIS